MNLFRPIPVWLCVDLPKIISRRQNVRNYVLEISDIKPERHSEFLNWLGEIVAVTKMFPACQWMYVTNGELDVEDNKIENKDEVVALWDSKEDYMKYIEWRGEVGTADKLAEYVNSDPVWRFMPVFMDCTK